MQQDNPAKNKKLRELVKAAIEDDDALRDKYQIGDKFRFIRDRLKALQQKVDESLSELASKSEDTVSAVGEDETLVYVYIFNAQGMTVPSWQKMVHPSVFYEYSINRPIYSEKSHIESYIRSKSNKMQHGYLTVAVKKTDILSTPEQAPKDAVGNPLLKVREGALHFERLQSFRHNDIDYRVKEDGSMKIKPSQA